MVFIETVSHFNGCSLEIPQLSLPYRDNKYRLLDE